MACSFWLVDDLHLIGRDDEAVALFERLLALRNDLGLLSEEYDPVAKRLVGNFPQAFSHVSLVNTAFRLLRGHATTASSHGPPRRHATAGAGASTVTAAGAGARRSDDRAVRFGPIVDGRTARPTRRRTL